MAMNTVPPQAYTRETLAAAYEWLKNQPIAIREMANNADTLVSLFLQARRRQTLGQMNTAGSLPPGVATHASNSAHSSQTILSNGNTHTPPPQTAKEEAHSLASEYYSSDSFKKDLKTLAEGMRQFEGPKISELHPQSTQLNTGFIAPTASHQPVATMTTGTPTSSLPSQFVQNPASLTQNYMHQNQNHATPISNQIAATHSQPTVFDTKTQDILRLVQTRLNLSSESDALRMLVVLGFEKIREILPK